MIDLKRSAAELEQEAKATENRQHTKKTVLMVVLTLLIAGASWGFVHVYNSLPGGNSSITPVIK